MSTSTVPAHEPVDMSLGEVARRIYAFFHNKRVGLLIILAMVVLTLLGVLFPQAPDAVRTDPQAWQAWLERFRPRYGGWTDPLAFLGMFSMFSSWAFRILSVLLALSIIACTTHRIPTLWKQAMHPRTNVGDRFFDVARVRGEATVPVPGAEALQAASDVLRRRGYRIVPAAGAEERAFYADRFRFAPFGTVVAHTAFVTILAGVLVTSLFGFRNDSFTAPVGQRVAVDGAAGYEMEALSFRDSYDAEGRPADYVSNVVLYHDGGEVAREEIRVNHPLKHGGYSFNQATFGAAAQVRVTKADATVVTDRSVPLSWSTEDEANVYGKFSLEDQGVEVYVVAPASGRVDKSIGAGQVMLEVYGLGSTEPLAQQVLSPGQPATLGELGYEFVRERQFTGLMVVKDPGAPIVWLGAALLMIGTCLTMFLRHHRIWVSTRPTADGTRLHFATPDRHDSIFERRFHDMVGATRDRLTPTTGGH